MTYIVFTVLTLLLGVAAVIVLRSRQQKRLTSRTQLIHTSGIAETELDPQGAVIVQGELWLAQSISGKRIQKRTAIKVVGVKEHLLLVAQR